MAANPQSKPTDFHCQSACNLLPSTSTIAIYCYYSGRKPILILPSHERRDPEWTRALKLSMCGRVKMAIVVLGSDPAWCLTGNMSKRHFCRIHYTIWRKIYNTIPARIPKCIAAFSLYIQNRQPYSDRMHSNAHGSHSGIRSRRQYVTDDVGDHVTKHVITRLRRHLAAEESTTWRPHQQPPRRLCNGTWGYFGER